MIAYMNRIVDPDGETSVCLTWQYRLQTTDYSIDGEVGVRESSDRLDILHLCETRWRPISRRYVTIHIGV
jgi:hypothetical protein